MPLPSDSRIGAQRRAIGQALREGPAARALQALAASGFIDPGNAFVPAG
jgi:hypothetical protein